MTTRDAGQVVFRQASVADAEALTALERDTNVVALSHVFAGLPFPFEEVRSRWLSLLADEAVRVEVAGPPARLDAYVAWDEEWLRHLGVRPERWGRGLGRLAVERAAGVRRLWVLRDNARARGLYEHLGWSPTGVERLGEWPPRPVVLEYGR
jgi:GNAT superfamily N-acetyltransferase